MENSKENTKQNTKTEAYVADALRKGTSLDTIKQSLLAVGWRVSDIDTAVAAGLLLSGVPAPEGGGSGGKGKLATAVEAAINVFSFILLGMIAYALVTLYYQIINKYFPDPLYLRSGMSSVDTGAIHYAIASLIIAFPLYVLAVRMWFKRFRDDSEKVETILTRGITYIVLLIASLTVVGDLVASLYKLLQGEISVRFVLEALTVLVVAGIIFRFYFLERRKIQYRSDIPRKTFLAFGWATLAFVLVGIILGFVVAGSPQHERMRGFDAQRSNDLRSLATCIGTYAANQKTLPLSLDELSQNTQYGYCVSNVLDPETASQYGYRIVTASIKDTAVPQASFELCADFSLDAVSDAAGVNTYAYPNDKWSTHGTGRSCTTEIVNLGNSQVPYTAPGIQPIMMK